MAILANTVYWKDRTINVTEFTATHSVFEDCRFVGDKDSLRVFVGATCLRCSFVDYCGRITAIESLFDVSKWLRLCDHAMHNCINTSNDGYGFHSYSDIGAVQRPTLNAIDFANNTAGMKG